MKLLKNLFWPKSDSADQEPTSESVENYSQEALLTLVSDEQNNSDTTVKAHAIAYLDDISSLTQLAKRSNAKIARSACQRLSRLLDDKKIKLNELIDSVDSNLTLLNIVGCCQDSGLHEKALKKITDDSELVALCDQIEVAAIRSEIAERIEDPDLLRQLAKSLKTKDKNAYKIAKNKLDAIKATEREREEQRKLLDGMLADSEQLKKREPDKYYGIHIDRLSRQWQDYEGKIEDKDQQLFCSNIEQCQQKNQAYEAQVAQEQARLDKLSNRERLQEHVCQQLQALLIQLYNLEHKSSSTMNLVAQSFHAQQQEWLDLKDLDNTNTQLQALYESLCDALQTLLAEVDEHDTLLSLMRSLESNNTAVGSPQPDQQTEEQSQQKTEQQPENTQQTIVIDAIERQVYLSESIDDFSPCQPIHDAIALLEKLNAQQTQQQKDRKERLRAIETLIRRARSSVNNKQLKAAIGIRYAIEEKSAPLSELPKHLEQSLKEVNAEIDKLIELQAEIIKPKKEALIRSMEQLVTVASIKPELLAERIKRLQDQWKSLSHGSHDPQEELWLRFKEQSEKAYEPCKAYFDERAKERNDNLHLRQNVIDQLDEFYNQCNWREVDWNAVEKIMRTARKEFHSYRPINRADSKSITETFDAKLAQLQEKLDGEFEKNKLAKEQIIKQAEKLKDINDLERAIDSTKRLQSQWKKSGRCRYEDAQSLWEVFRGHCDVVFERKSQQAAQEKQEEQQRIDQLNSVLTELKNLTELPTEEFLSSRSHRDELVEQFQQISDIPEREQKQSNKMLEKTLAAFDARVKREIKARDAKAWKAIFELFDDLNQFIYESKINNSEGAGTKEDCMAKIEGIPFWPENIKPLLIQQLECSGSQQQSSTTSSDNLAVEVYRDICTQMEIIVDTESPKVDHERRARLQLERLKTQFGDSQVSDLQAREFLQQWVSAAACPPDVYKELLKRFEYSWARI